MNDNVSKTMEISDETTIVARVEDCVDHVNINNLILDHNKEERPPFKLNCGCCTDEINCSRSFLVISTTYFLLFMVIICTFLYLVLAESSLHKIGIIAVLSKCIGYLIPKSDK